MEGGTDAPLGVDVSAGAPVRSEGSAICRDFPLLKYANVIFRSKAVYLRLNVIQCGVLIEQAK